MTTAGIITIEIQGKDASLGDILDRMQAKATAFERAAQESMSGAGGAAEGARAGFLNLQATIARNEIAVGRAAVANKDYTTSAEAFASANARLNAIINDESASVSQVLSAQRQLVSVYSAATKAAEQEAAAIAKVNNANSGGGSLAAQLAQQTSGIERLTGAFGGLQSVLGSVGIAVGAKQILDMGINAGRASLELQQTENQLKQIAGSQDVYNKILQTAKQQQILFGGSLNDNLSELSSFAVAARTTGADLDQLIRTAQRLATLDPAQGIGGAKLALNEALSGNATSLNRRFEIPKAALDGLSDSSTTAAQKLAIVNKYLDDAGISANGAADAVTADAKAFNELAAALDTMKTSGGGALAQLFAPLATNAAQAIEALNGTRTAAEGFQQATTGIGSTLQPIPGALGAVVNPLGTYNAMFFNAAASVLGWTTQQQAANAAALQSAQTFQQYGQAVAQTGQDAQLLNQTQFQIAQGFMQQGQSAQLAIQNTMALSAAQQQYIAQLTSEGVAMTTALTQAQAMGTTFNAIAVAQQALADSGTASAGAISNLGTLMQQAASGGAQAQATVNSLAIEFQNGSISAQQLYAALQAIINATAQAKGVTDPYVASLTATSQANADATVATQQYQQSLQDEAAQSLMNQTNTETLGIAKQNLQAAAQAAANAVLASGGNIEAEAARLAASSSLVDQLTAAFLRLHAAQSGANNPAGFAATAAAAAQGRVPTEDQSRVFNQLVASKKAQEAYTLAVGSAAEQQALLQHRVDQTTRYLGANSAEAIKARQALVQFQNQQDKANAPKKGRGGGGGGAGAAKLSDQAKLNNSLASNAQRYNDQIEEAQITHGKNLQKIEQDYQDKISDIQLKALQKRKQQADANEIGKRSSELGFLESATSSSLNGSKNGQADLGRIQADYYKAFDDAQKAAQAGDLEKSDRMLKAAEDRANTELKYAEKIADLKDKMGEAHNSKERAALQAQIGLQETLLTKARQIQDVKDQQNAAAPDAINATEQQDIQKALADRQQALTDETGRAADAMDKLTRSLENRNDLATGNALRAGKNVSANGAPAGASALDNSTPAPTTPATPIPVAPVNTGSSTPLAINAPDVITAINQLQTGLDAIRGAVESAGNQVASKIQNQRFEVVTRSVS